MSLKILFIANDAGGGSLIVPIAERAHRDGHRLSFIASCLSLSLWKERGLKPFAVTAETSEVEIQRLIAQTAPDVVVTGTSIATYLERRVWSAARKLSCKTLAMVDGWVKIPHRFLEGNAARVLPDRFGVVDKETARILAETCGVSLTAVDIIGHPHLQKVAHEVAANRISREKNPQPLIVFFSTPIVNTEAEPGVATITELLPFLEAYGPMRLVVKPHPREQSEPWRKLIGEAARQSRRLTVELVSDVSAADLLKRADAVLGLPTSVLIEAAFAGVPALALRYHAKSYANSALELYLKGNITEMVEELPSHLEKLFKNAGGPERMLDSPVIAEADRRGLEAIRSLAKAKP